MAPTDQQSSTSASTPASTPTCTPTSTPTGVPTTAPGAPAAVPVGGRGDAGMATAEYAIATLAACGFAGLLVAILTSGEVRGLLLGIVQRALTLG